MLFFPAPHSVPIEPLECKCLEYSLNVHHTFQGYCCFLSVIWFLIGVQVGLKFAVILPESPEY